MFRGNGGDPGSLDPALAQDEHAFNVLADLYEGLLTHGADGTLLPGVAERWTISDDGLIYTFHLRENARWSNGEPVTAAHFAAAFARARDSDTAAPLSFLLSSVASTNVRDDRTLAITLETPTPYFESVLAMAIASPVWPGAEAGEVSNGPYQLDEWIPGERIRLHRNEFYHSNDDVAFETVEYFPIADPSAEYRRYAAGELDITATIPAAHLQKLRTEAGNELRVAPKLAVYYLVLDLTGPPLDDRAVREALSRAIDREALVEVLGRGEQPAYGFVPDGIAGYSPARYAWAKPLPELDAIPPITLLYDTGDVHETVALAVASMWRDALGIDVTLEKREWKYFLDSRDQRQDWDVMRFAWTGDYAHPTTFLELFYSDGPLNLPAWSSESFDRLVAAGEYRQAETLMLADYPVIPLYFYVSKHLVHPSIKGFVDNPLDLHPSRYLSR
ncbi:MAG: peptide ABC transporter substrate-binding protein [Woeseiaceae bacterium]|nr:peptide ABC transporter substrate-binding protein [Woeseiaceae bacterium]